MMSPGKFLVAVAISILTVAQGASAQITAGEEGNQQSVVQVPAKQPCGGYVVIQVKDNCPECEDFKKLPTCPDYVPLSPPPKPGCELNICIQKLKEKQLSQCISDDGKKTFFPCCVPGDNSKPSSGRNCLSANQLKCCDGDPCRWGCSSWQKNAPRSTTSTPTCARESTWGVANPNGLPGCDCDKRGSFPLPPTICGERNPKLPKECEKFECLPGRPCTIVPDCREVSCCYKSDFCRANSPVCKDVPKESACLKKCTSDGTCIYDCKDGCCCPEKDVQKCKDDCVLSAPNVKVCTTAEAM
jgi:hypothetical protein